MAFIDIGVGEKALKSVLKKLEAIAMKQDELAAELTKVKDQVAKRRREVRDLADQRRGFVDATGIRCGNRSAI